MDINLLDKPVPIQDQLANHAPATRWGFSSGHLLLIAAALALFLLFITVKGDLNFIKDSEKKTEVTNNVESYDAYTLFNRDTGIVAGSSVTQLQPRGPSN